MLGCDVTLGLACPAVYCATICSITEGSAFHNILRLRISVSILNQCTFTWEILFPNFLLCETNIHYFLLSHLRNSKNLEYIPILLIFVNTLFRNSNLSERFKVHDMIINFTTSNSFQHYPKYSLSECCHSRHNTFTIYLMHLQNI
jgi:hypothetical protein